MTAEFTYRMALAGLLITFMPFAFRFRMRSHTGEPLRRIDEGLLILVGLRLVGLGNLVCQFAYLFGADWIQRFSVELPAVARWSGLGIGILAGAGVIWTFSTLGKNLTDTVAVRKNAELVTSGPYRWVRHPFYLNALILLCGVSLISANFLILGFGLVALIFLSFRTPIEEAKLIERFGDDYRSYAGRTGRFFPRLRGS